MNEQTIRRWYDIFKNNNQLTEIRIFEKNGKRTLSGYFTNIETLLNNVRIYNNDNIYFTLNRINDACYSREQHDKIIINPKSTTSDNAIIARDWILIDIDCDKPSDTNSTDDEKESAKPIVNSVFKFLRDEGFNDPIICDSSNGFHLLYRCAMINNPNNTETIKSFLIVLNMLFSTDKVKIDTSTFNASRICKLYGSLSRKGSNTKERPQRESKILRVPNEIKISANEYFEKIANMIPKEEAPNRSNNYSNESFDLDDFISKYNIKVRNIVKTASYTKYVLEECCFDSSHHAPDAALFKMNNGAIGYKCLHNSCSQYTWHDVRLHFDPNAYDKREYREFQQKQRYINPIRKEDFKPLEETSDKGKKWLSMTDIKYIDINSIVAIPTGYIELDRKIMGLLLGDVTIISGLSGTGKTSWIDCLCLNVIQKGYKVAIWSGELQGFRFQGWINQIAAGKNYVKKKDGYDNIYYAPEYICKKINEWDKDKMFLYNNEYGSKWMQLFNDIKEIVEKDNISLVIIDNLMSLNISDYDGDKNNQQTLFINDLKEYSKRKNIHIVLVCHPRKDNGFLRKESISGTADLTNLCDNLLIIHRIGKDFQTRANDFLDARTISNCMKYDSVIEVCKNRSMGVMDYFIGMYYEQESRRLKNSISENIVYGWEEIPIETSIDFKNDMPFEPSEDTDYMPF